jgi:hypothetical protein
MWRCVEIKGCFIVHIRYTELLLVQNFWGYLQLGRRVLRMQCLFVIIVLGD